MAQHPAGEGRQSCPRCTPKSTGAWEGSPNALVTQLATSSLLESTVLPSSGTQASCDLAPACLTGRAWCGPTAWEPRAHYQHPHPQPPLPQEPARLRGGQRGHIWASNWRAATTRLGEPRTETGPLWMVSGKLVPCPRGGQEVAGNRGAGAGASPRHLGCPVSTWQLSQPGSSELHSLSPQCCGALRGALCPQANGPHLVPLGSALRSMTSARASSEQH